MSPQTKLILECAAGVLGFVCFVGLFATARQSPVWVRCCFLALAFLALCYGALSYAHDRYRTSLQYRTRTTLDHYRTLVAGVGVGGLAVLAVSGQIKLKRKQPDEV